MAMLSNDRVSSYARIRFRYVLAAAVVMLVAGSSRPACADERVTGLRIGRVRIAPGATFVGAHARPSKACSYSGEYFKFDHTTPHGKAILTLLLFARSKSSAVDISYTASAVAGTTETSGCNPTTMAILTGVSLPAPPELMPIECSPTTPCASGLHCCAPGATASACVPDASACPGTEPEPQPPGRCGNTAKCPTREKCCSGECVPLNQPCRPERDVP